jgi:hypothetical protein
LVEEKKKLTKDKEKSIEKKPIQSDQKIKEFNLKTI